ncbi:hypothetical protein OG889_17530 [Streptomyces sp. NBC_00481]|uniref:tetratricopeptide repeat protein n=1 Tax=unclassified Streptomyces TaxID=2593676 RepID=UPI002DDBAA0C|nr:MULTISPECIES: hypothetical protein [unclassified Streptomyces]WRY96385.1 hypothetical protein OG889_17530 [Streptomyces sp. NBC_00481]
MTRLSREQKRELKRAGRAPAGLTPIDVRVSAEAGATVGGMSVPPAAGESLQAAALDYLHRLALATGHPVLATVHDERIGYVVPLQIHVDGSSHYAGEPVRVGEPRGFAGAPPVSEREGAVPGAGVRGHVAADPGVRTPGIPPAPAVGPTPVAGRSGTAAAAHLGEEAARWAAPESPEPPAPAHGPRRDRSTHVLRAVPESAAAGPELPDDQDRSNQPTGTAPHAQPQPQPQPQPQQYAQAQPEPSWQAQAQAERRPQPDVLPEAQPERQPQQYAQAQPEPSWQAQVQAERRPQPDVLPEVQPERQPQLDGEPQAQAQAQPQWSAQAGPESSAHPERQPHPHPQPQPEAQRDVRPEAQARPESRTHSQEQPRREPSTMRLAAGKPVPSTESAAPEPERPKREPSTLPLSAAKPAPAVAPPHAMPESSVAPGAQSDRPSAEPVAAAAPEVKREPRTMPLTAAKEKQGQQGQPSDPVSGGVAPSTYVLRAVPEPKEGPLARPPRTPGLPLTLPGIPVDPDGKPSSAEPTGDAAAASGTEPTGDAAPTPGTVSPPTGEFGPVMDPELLQPPARTTPRPWHPEQATTPPDISSDTPRSASASLNPQPWPPAPAEDPTPQPTHEPSPSPSPASEAAPESGPATLEPQPWPPTPTPAPTPMPTHTTAPAPTPEPAFAPAPASASASASASAPPVLAPPEESATDAYSAPEWKVLEEDSAPKPAPVREFDAVAEAVLDTAEEGGDTASPFAEPVSRINEAVKLGRIQEAAEMAEQTVAQATATLGPQHPEVLKLRELTAYIAYLAGDALRSFHLSLDLAVLRHRLRDQRAAYGNVQSAAAAWRAVRDPLQGLHLGRDLIAVWADLAADAGPAADDLEQLEKARTRMTRLTERARALDPAPYAHGQ